MINKIKTLVAVAALSGSLGANVYAAMQKGDTPLNLLNVHQPSINQSAKKSVLTDRIHPVDATTTADQHTVVNKTVANKVSVLPTKQSNQLITDVIQTGANDTNQMVNQKLTALAAGPILPKDVAPVASSGASQVNGAATASEPSPSSANTDAIAAGTDTSTTAADPATDTAGTDVNPSQINTDSTLTGTVASTAPATADTATTAVTDTSSATAAANTDAPPAATDSTPAASKAEPAPAPAPAPNQDSAPAQNTDSGKVITVKATAYTASCTGCSGITATGINIKANPNAKVIAVDPKVIPLGSKVYVEGVGYATAADTGGAIKGNHIDVFIPSEKEALKFGVKHLNVKILN